MECHLGARCPTMNRRQSDLILGNLRVEAEQHHHLDSKSFLSGSAVLFSETVSLQLENHGEDHTNSHLTCEFSEARSLNPSPQCYLDVTTPATQADYNSSCSCGGHDLDLSRFKVQQHTDDDGDLLQQEEPDSDRAVLDSILRDNFQILEEASPSHCLAVMNSLYGAHYQKNMKLQLGDDPHWYRFGSPSSSETSYPVPQTGSPAHELCYTAAGSAGFMSFRPPERVQDWMALKPVAYMNPMPYYSSCAPPTYINCPAATAREQAITSCRMGTMPDLNHPILGAKRQRIYRTKPGPETDNQRMNHIAMERNRRKQMNQHLLDLKSLMPCSYIQKNFIGALQNDQASIIGGAVEFIKELEQVLKSMQQERTRRRALNAETAQGRGETVILPLATSADESSTSTLAELEESTRILSSLPENTFQLRAESTSSVAAVEVKFLRDSSDAIVNVITQWRAKQLVEVIAALESFHISILHTQVTKRTNAALYTFNVKVESECTMTVNEIAAALQKTFTDFICTYETAT